MLYQIDEKERNLQEDTEPDLPSFEEIKENPSFQKMQANQDRGVSPLSINDEKNEIFFQNEGLNFQSLVSTPVNIP